MSRHILAISKEVPLYPPVPSQRTVQEARPIHILLLWAHLIICLRSLSPPPLSLALSLGSLSFNFPHYSPRLALENRSRLLQHHPFLVYRSVRTLSDVSMEAVGCAVGSFVLWHHCSPPPITETLSPLCWAQIRSAERLWISTAESSHCSCCSRLQILDWQGNTSLVQLLNSSLFIFT